MAFVQVAKAADVPVGQIRQVAAGAKTIALANVGGTFHAMDGICLHRGGPLGEGMLEGIVVTCPWHGWQYDVTTGKNTLDPAVAVSSYPVELRGDEVFVDVG